ncbi:unnamed protein product [Closterium sp. NIES-65]|nr:unnamed protein product [Closterium sp. NIES-65]
MSLDSTKQSGQRQNQAAVLPETAPASPSISVLTNSDVADVSENADASSKGSSGRQQRGGNVEAHSSIPDPRESEKGTVTTSATPQPPHHHGSTSLSQPNETREHPIAVPLASIDSATLQQLFERLVSSMGPARPDGQTLSGTTDLSNVSRQPLAAAPRNTEATFNSFAVPIVGALVAPDQIESNPAGGGGSLRFYYFTFPNGVCGFFQADGQTTGSLVSTHASPPEPTIGSNLGSANVSYFPDSQASTDVRSFGDGSSRPAACGGSEQTAAWVGVGGQGEMRVGNEGGMRIAEGQDGEIQITTAPILQLVAECSHPPYAPLGDIGQDQSVEVAVSSSFHADADTMDMAPPGGSGCNAIVPFELEGATEMLENDAGVNADFHRLMVPHQMPVSSITPGAAPEGLHNTSVASDTCQHSRLKAAEPDREPAGVNCLPSADVLATTGGTLEAQAVTSLLTPWEAQQLLAAAAAAAGTNGPHRSTTLDSSHLPGSLDAPHPPHYLVQASEFPVTDSPIARGAAADAAAPSAVYTATPSAADAAAVVAAAADRTVGAAECTNAESLLMGGCDDFTSLLLMDPFSLVDSLSLPYPFAFLDSLPSAANALRGDSPRGDKPTGVFSTAAQAAAYGGEGSGGDLAGAAGVGPSSGQNGDAEVGEGLPQASLDFMAQEELFQALLLEEAPESAARRLLSATCGAVMPAGPAMNQLGDPSGNLTVNPCGNLIGDPSGDPTVHSSLAFREAASAPGAETCVMPRNAGESSGTGVALPDEGRQEGGKQQKKRKKTQTKAEVVPSMQGGQKDAAAVKVAFSETTSTPVAEACAMPRSTGSSSDTEVALAVGRSEAVLKAAVGGAAAAVGREEGGKQQKKRKKAQKKAELVSSMEVGQLEGAPVKAAPQAKKARKQKDSQDSKSPGQGNTLDMAFDTNLP